MGFIKEIEIEGSKVKAEIQRFRQFKAIYESKNKKDIVKDYLVICGGLPYIVHVFGDTGFFLDILEKEYYQICFTRQYIDKLKVYFEQLENLYKKAGK